MKKKIHSLNLTNQQLFKYVIILVSLIKKVIELRFLVLYHFSESITIRV
jgi:hypothetical protein